MPRRPRFLFEGAFYHAFNRGVEQRSIALDDLDRRTFLQNLADAVEEFQFRLFVYCLMDNHFHLFLQTPLPNLNQIMQAVQGRYAQYINMRHRRVGALFQGRYKARLVDTERYALTLARYIHRNPLEAGLIRHLEDYPWSSYPAYVGTQPKWKWLETPWLLNQFHEDPLASVEQFEGFHLIPPPVAELRILRNMRYPLGKPG